MFHVNFQGCIVGNIVGGMEGWRKILCTGEKLASSQSGMKAQKQAALNRNSGQIIAEEGKSPSYFMEI